MGLVTALVAVTGRTVGLVTALVAVTGGAVGLVTVLVAVPGRAVGRVYSGLPISLWLKSQVLCPNS